MNVSLFVLHWMYMAAWMEYEFYVFLSAETSVRRMVSEFVVAFNVFSNGKHIWLQLHEGCFLYHILVSVCKVSLENDVYTFE